MFIKTKLFLKAFRLDSNMNKLLKHFQGEKSDQLGAKHICNGNIVSAALGSHNMEFKRKQHWGRREKVSTGEM